MRKGINISHVSIENMGGRDQSQVKMKFKKFEKVKFIPKDVPKSHNDDTEEEEVILEFALEIALQGWPLDKKHIRAHVNAICWARLGGIFPENEVGLNWVDWFLKRHTDHIQTY